METSRRHKRDDPRSRKHCPKLQVGLQPAHGFGSLHLRTSTPASLRDLAAGRGWRPDSRIRCTVLRHRDLVLWFINTPTYLKPISSAAACCRFHSAKLASSAFAGRSKLRRTKAPASLRTPNTSPYLWNGVLHARFPQEDVTPADTKPGPQSSPPRRKHGGSPSADPAQETRMGNLDGLVLRKLKIAVALQRRTIHFVMGMR
jgi:hypothetical protein